MTKKTKAAERPEQTTVKTMNAKQRQRARELCSQLPLLQHELFTMGLVVTSAHMAKTIEKLGYELCLADLHAGRITEQAKDREDWLRKNGRGDEIAKERAQAVRSAEKMLTQRVA